MTRALLYTYRRCPYAMRARMALLLAGVAFDAQALPVTQQWLQGWLQSELFAVCMKKFS